MPEATVGTQWHHKSVYDKLSLDGLEPSTPSLKVRCSNQLS